MPDPRSSNLSRRVFLRTASALAAGATALAAAAGAQVAGLRPTRPAAAHNLPPGSFGSPVYTEALNATGGVKAVFQSPNVEAALVQGKDLNHLLLIQLKNWLNGFQFSYQIDPVDLHTIVATYASANLFTYAGAVWEKSRLGETYNIIDPATGAPAIRNVFWPSRFGPEASADPDAPTGIYQDTGIEALQRRGAVFLT